MHKYIESYRGKIHSLDEVYAVIHYPKSLHKKGEQSFIHGAALLQKTVKINGPGLTNTRIFLSDVVAALQVRTPVHRAFLTA